MSFLWFIGFIALVLLVFLLPYDWWQKPPARQPDRIIGKLLPFLAISLRNVVLRAVFLCLMLFVYLQTMVFLPLFAGAMIGGAVAGSAWQRIRGKRAEPVSGLIILTVIGAVFATGIVAPLRMVPIAAYLLLGRPAGTLWEALTIGKGWATWDGIIGLCGIFGVASWMLVDGIWRYRQARQVENLPTSRIGSLAMGLVEVQGTVRPLPGSDAEPPVRVSYGMANYVVPEQSIRTFLLEDRSGSVRVDASACRVRAGWIAEAAAIFGTREIVLTKRVTRDDFTDTVEKRLEYGDRVYVIGNAERDASGVTVIRPASRPAWNEVLWSTLFGAFRPPRQTDIHDVFFLTDGSEREARARILKGFRTVLFWGLLWISASALIIWTGQQPWRQAPPIDSWRSASWRGPEPNPNPMVLDYTGRNERLFRFEKYMKTLDKTSVDQVPALIEALGYEDYRFYEPASWALVKLSDKAKEHAGEIVPLLVGHLHPCRDNAKSLQTTIVTLSIFGPDAAPSVPALIEQLSCEKTNTYEVTPDIIQFQAARTLGEIGPAAADAVPALRQLLDRRPSYVRTEAARAIRKIEAGGSP
jgi:hypothetical protein